MYIHFVFCGFIILLIQELRAANLVQINPGLVNKQVDRFVDLSSQLAKLSNKITLENTGKSAVKNFLFTVEPEFSAHLSFVHAQTGDSSKTPLQVQPIKVEGHESEPFWQIEIGVLQPGKTITVDIEIAYTYVLSPHPAAITQNDKQLVRYSGNHYFYSPYATLKHSTTVTLNTRNIESYSKLKPTTQSDNKINYGPYEKIPGFSIDTLTVHYENNSPFLSITRLERVIEVSHWGNIAVEETIDVKHNGAVLKGPFSRYEYQREAHSGVSSIKSFKTILPAAASDAYYRDEIGNISTSHMKVMSDSVELDLRPRFPLFGGWKTHYVIGYNVPSYEYLYNAGDDFLLKMRLVDHVFDDMVVDEVITKIILPEGSHDIQLSTPYAVERLPDTLHFTYLDTTGRPVITLRKKNLVEHHIQDFDLQYTFPKTLMFQEPLLVVIAFYLLFILVIIYVRLDFSITKDEAGESRMRISGFCEKVLAHQDKRGDYYSLTDDQLAKLKSSKDVTAFQTSMKNINRDYKNETSHIAELVAKLKIDAPEIADKVLELQKLDTHLKELYVQVQSLYVDKLVPGKINRQQFLDLEGQLNKKKEDCVDKINALVKSLH